MKTKNFKLSQSKIFQLSAKKRIKEIIFSYNILMEFYIMINKFISKYEQQANPVHRYFWGWELTKNQYQY